MLPGLPGIRIPREIVASERTAATLATMRDTRCKLSVETIQSVLVGNYQLEPVFAFAQALAVYDAYQALLEIYDQQMARVCSGPPSRSSHPASNSPSHVAACQSRMCSFYQLGLDPPQIHDNAPYLALRLVAECGTDLSRRRTAYHFTSWLTLAPGCRISGGKVLSANTRKTKNLVAAQLCLAAVAIGKTNTVLGAFYRCLSARICKATAVTATARKIAILLYNTMPFGMAYQDSSADHYEQKYRERVVKGLHRRAVGFGFALQTVQGVLR